MATQTYKQFGIEVLREPLARFLRSKLKTITHVETRDRVAALTFDDGPNPRCTPRLVELLERHGARGTFFMIGQAAQKYRDVVKRVAQGGHAIGNHTWDHPSLPLLSPSEQRSQLRSCQRAIAPYSQGLFRPPFGHQNVSSRLAAAFLRLRVVTWSVQADDWLDHDAEWMARRAIAEIRPGSIILFHDSLYTFLDEGHTDREPMLGAIELILRHFGNRFRFVSRPELLSRGQPQLQSWYRWGSEE